jgi:hypothetical protein|tara:strand:+ start:53 stop:802 length:750 start_codon:yes stop_codon:yes gene_type:complete
MAQQGSNPMGEMSTAMGNNAENDVLASGYHDLGQKQQDKADFYELRSADIYEGAMNRYDDTAKKEKDMFYYARRNKERVMNDQLGQLGNQSALASKFGQQGMDSASMQMAQQGAQRAASYGASGGEDARSALAGAQSAQRTLTDAYTGIASNDAQMRQQNQQNMLSQQNNLTGQMAGAQNQFYDWTNDAWGKNVLNPQYNKSSIEFGRSDMFQDKSQNMQDNATANYLNQMSANAANRGETVEAVGNAI